MNFDQAKSEAIKFIGSQNFYEVVGRGEIYMDSMNCAERTFLPSGIGFMKYSSAQLNNSAKLFTTNDGYNDRGPILGCFSL